LQPEGKLKPTDHKTITVTYNIPRPDFSGTSYKPEGKAGETNGITQPGERWYQVVETDKDLAMKVTAEPQQHWNRWTAPIRQTSSTNLLTIMKK